MQRHEIDMEDEEERAGGDAAEHGDAVLAGDDDSDVESAGEDDGESGVRVKEGFVEADMDEVCGCCGEALTC